MATITGDPPFEFGSDGLLFGASNRLKYLSIPKVVVPTGLSPDQRPTSVQLWGRCVPFGDTFDDKVATEHAIEFLHLAKRLASAIQADL